MNSINIIPKITKQTEIYRHADRTKLFTFEANTQQRKKSSKYYQINVYIYSNGGLCGVGIFFYCTRNSGI